MCTHTRALRSHTGGCSGALSVSVIYPLDLIRTRISASSNAQVGWGDTARGIYRAEGVSGFYRGLNVALSGIVPGLAMNWVSAYISTCDARVAFVWLRD